MATTIDHLSADHMVRVLQDFVDARGVHHRAGEEGRIIALGFDMRTNDISIEWLRDGKSETMVFDLRERSGPGNGRMRQYFELGEYVNPGREGMRFVPNYGYVPIAPPELPMVTGKVITTDARYDDAIERVWALAGRKRFDEAEEQIRAIAYATDRRGDNSDRLAGSVCGLAVSHAFDADPAVYEWLRDRGISLWYAWGSGATSGGEGTERGREIRKVEKAFKDLERARTS